MLNEIDEFCQNNDDLSYDELYQEVEKKVNTVLEFAKANHVPVKVDTYSIVTRFKEDQTESNDYEESSSYYEEEDSEYYDDEYTEDDE